MDTAHLVGSYYVLTKLPIWATAMILYFATLGIIHIGRDYFEGLPYQVAYSAQFGDAALFGVVLLAAGILQQHTGSIIIPQWLESSTVHMATLAASLALGVLVSVLTLKTRSGQAMDVYHDVVIAPIIVYLAITLLPVIYFNGTRIEKVTTVCFILFWLALVVFDIKAERMNQREWLTKNGVHFIR